MPFDPALHLTQHETPITVLPWSVSPMNALKTIAGLPSTNLEKDGIDFSQSFRFLIPSFGWLVCERLIWLIIGPRSLKPVLFAAYPLLIPICSSSFLLLLSERRLRLRRHDRLG